MNQQEKVCIFLDTYVVTTEGLLEGLLKVHSSIEFQEIEVGVHQVETLMSSDPVRRQQIRTAQKTWSYQRENFLLSEEDEWLEVRFSQVLTKDFLPSYASVDFACETWIEATLRGEKEEGGTPFWSRAGRSIAQMLSPSSEGDPQEVATITVITPHQEEGQEASGPSLDLDLSANGYQLEVLLAGDRFAYDGEVGGTFVLDYDSSHVSEEEPLAPARLNVRLAAIEQSKLAELEHRKVLWLKSEEYRDLEGVGYPMQGAFVLPFEGNTFFSGEWKHFKVFFGFRVNVFFRDGFNVRSSKNLEVYRRYRALS